MTQNITCISCPMGCALTVAVENGKVISVKDNACPRGTKYAEAECTNPTRTVTSTIRLEGAEIGAAPVKTEAPIPKNKIKGCVLTLKDIVLTAPVKAGQVVMENICGTGVDVIATRSIPSKK